VVHNVPFRDVACGYGFTLFISAPFEDEEGDFLYACGKKYLTGKDTDQKDQDEPIFEPEPFGFFYQVT
jgi:hypothetical protein